MKKGILLAGFLVLVTQIYNFSVTFMRVLKKVSHLSLTIVVNILGVALFSIAGAYFFGVLGLITGLMIATFLSAFFAYRLSGMRLRFYWNAGEVWRLIRIGFPLVLAGYALDTFLIVDTIMIGKMIGYNQLGFYTIALMSIQQINSLGRFSQIILLPHIQEKYGKTKDLTDAKSLFVKSTTTLVYFLPVIIALVFFGVPVVVHYFLPKFNPGLVAMRILVTAYYFVAVNEMSGSILFTINKQARQIPIFAAMIVMAIGLNYLFIKTKGGIEGVALATTIAYFFYFAFFFYYAFKHLMEKPELHRNILAIIGIFAYMSLLLHGTESLCHLANPLAGCVVKFLIFLLLFSPVLVFFEKKEGVLKTIVSIFHDKWKGAFRATG
jgi:O-antigen/teichoic acid export membrane protein